MQLIETINDRAELFCADNYKHPTPADFQLIVAAMLIGAAAAIEQEVEYTRKQTEEIKQSHRL